MTYRHPARTKQFVRTLLLAGLAFFTSGVMHDAQAQQAPIPLGCFKDQGDPQGTNGRDLSGFMFVAPAELPTYPRPGKPGIISRPPGGGATIVRPPQPGMTNAMCSAECGKRGFLFAGTQYSTYCFCGNQYGRSGPSMDCKTPCNGNAGEICGGAWANSVHWTGLTATPTQGWTGSARCQVDIRGSNPSYADSRTHTWTLIGAPTPAPGGEAYNAIWNVTGSGSKSTATGSAQWNVRAGSSGPIRIWIRTGGASRVITSDHSQLSMYNGILGTQQVAGGIPGTLGAQADEYAFPTIDAPLSATAITGASNGATNGTPGYVQPGTAQGTYTCTWNFQKR